MHGITEAVGIEGVQKQLDRLSDMLTAVQKALGQTCCSSKTEDSRQALMKPKGDYLEKQRSQFARFYFVGDEDGILSDPNPHTFAHVTLTRWGLGKDPQKESLEPFPAAKPSATGLGRKSLDIS